MQKRLNISINDYKDYCLFSDIIVELIPYPFTSKYGGKFINIRDDQKNIFIFILMIQKRNKKKLY